MIDIVHLIHNEKFTEGYILFMKKKYPNVSQKFITIGNKFSVNIEDVIILNTKKDLFSKEVLFLFNNSKKIIVSGMVYPHYFLFLRKKIIKKFNVQFWGQDFYIYRNVKFFSKMFFKKMCLKYILNNCESIINLIDEDYDELYKIIKFNSNVKHYVACMPENPNNRLDYKTLLNNRVNTNNIIVGNSATIENHHIEVFEMLQQFKDEDIDIYCPLSYGDNNYAEKVSLKGKEIFGEKFHPIRDYMSVKDYYSFLNTCSIGIFFNDRQQALGNIYYLLKTGGKVYLRDKTSMWNYFEKNGIKIFPCEKIVDMDMNNLFYLDKDIKMNNFNIFMNIRKQLEDNWNEIIGG